MRSRDTTEILREWTNGRREALTELHARIEHELTRRARAYLRGNDARHSIETRDLVNEAYLKLIKQDAVRGRDRAHFMALASTTMRHILVDRARKRLARKRDGERVAPAEAEQAVATDPPIEDLLELDVALSRLQELHPRQHAVVELRYFGGMSIAETADVLGVGTATVSRDWKDAQAWLHQEMSGRPSCAATVRRR